MRRSNVELPAGAGVEVTTGVAESTDLPYYGVEVPGLDELWSYDRGSLVEWLTTTGAELAAAPEPPREVVET
jgi:hypothetical protein